MTLPMNTYQKEQLDALRMIRELLDRLPDTEIEFLNAQIAEYLEFRSRVGAFLEMHFKDICTEKCYSSRLSACCSKDGIVAFFADAVINALVGDQSVLDHLEEAIISPGNAFKCIFLSETGCLWQVKPIVCEMFLCVEAENRAFGNAPEVSEQWEIFREMKKSYTWPDRPVLFEVLESYFINRGYESSLMYFHNSPGLLRIIDSREK